MSPSPASAATASARRWPVQSPWQPECSHTCPPSPVRKGRPSRPSSSKGLPQWAHRSGPEAGGGFRHNHSMAQHAKAWRYASLRDSPPSCAPIPARSWKNASQSPVLHSADSSKLSGLAGLVTVGSSLELTACPTVPVPMAWDSGTTSRAPSSTRAAKALRDGRARGGCPIVPFPIAWDSGTPSWELSVIGACPRPSLASGAG